MHIRLPYTGSRKIGLLGGSFNPAHQGHVSISLTALKKLNLDEVWWIVSPGNPLKDKTDLLSFKHRIMQAKNIIGHHNIQVLDFEASLSSPYTIDTLTWMRLRKRKTRFVWLMGADNLVQFHRWQGWQKIIRLMPLAVINRPSFSQKALHSKAAQTFWRLHIAEYKARTLLTHQRKRWVFLNAPLSQLSSTSIRQNQT